MSTVPEEQGPLNSINQVIFVLNKVIGNINTCLGLIFNGTPNTLAGYDNSGDFTEVTVGTGLNLTGDVLTATGSEDIHSGLYLIETGESREITVKKQMVTFGSLTIEAGGSLIVNGQYFVRI